MRAVYSSLPRKFGNHNKRKSEWKSNLRGRLKRMIADEHDGLISQQFKVNSAYFGLGSVLGPYPIERDHYQPNIIPCGLDSEALTIV